MKMMTSQRLPDRPRLAAATSPIVKAMFASEVGVPSVVIPLSESPFRRMMMSAPSVELVQDTVDTYCWLRLMTAEPVRDGPVPVEETNFMALTAP